jgi:hypothetical protein
VANVPVGGFKFSAKPADNISWKGADHRRDNLNAIPGCCREARREIEEMDSLYLWEDKNGEQRTEKSKEEEAAPAPAAAIFPKVKISDCYTGRYRWTGPETLWVAPPEDRSKKK